MALVYDRHSPYCPQLVCDKNIPPFWWKSIVNSFVDHIDLFSVFSRESIFIIPTGKMDSLVGYGSEDENESERYGAHLTSVSMTFSCLILCPFALIGTHLGMCWT